MVTSLAAHDRAMHLTFATLIPLLVPGHSEQTDAVSSNIINKKEKRS
jgi:hypothetical protein